MDAAREKVVTVARRLFADGVAPVRMSDVADAAGMSRAYLYRLVPSKQGLVELSVVARCEEYGADLERRSRTATGDVADEIVEMTLFGIALAASDPEFGRLAAALPYTRLNELLTAADSPIRAVLTQTFEPLLDRAVDEGRLRSDVSREHIYVWLQSIHAHLASRADLAEPERRALLRDFLLPALLTS